MIMSESFDDALVAGIIAIRRLPSRRRPVEVGLVRNDDEPACPRRLFGPPIRASCGASDHDRLRSELPNTGLDRLSVGSAPTADDSDSHVTDPEIHTNADAAAPSRRRASKDSSMCQPETERSSTTIIEGAGAAIR